jgi:hypothetical protein
MRLSVGYDFGGYPYYSAYAADPGYRDWCFLFHGRFYGSGFDRRGFGG